MSAPYHSIFIFLFPHFPSFFLYFSLFAIVRLQEQLRSRDDTISSLMGERLRLNHQLSLVSDERRAWTERIAALQAEAEKKVSDMGNAKKR